MTPYNYLSKLISMVYGIMFLSVSLELPMFKYFAKLVVKGVGKMRPPFLFKCTSTLTILS